MEDSCGLITPEKLPVPLQSVEVQVDVKDHVATVVSTLLYQNTEEKPIEAVFFFPMSSEAAVCHFSAKVGQTLIVAEVKEKDQDREEYDDALSSSQRAFLMERSDQSPDIFSINVGSLPPGESASIRLEYVTELDVQADEALRFCLPAVLNPRYQPAVPYDLSFLARVQSARLVSKVESNCTMDPLEFLSQDHTSALVKLAAGHKFDRDVELLIYYKDTHEPSAVVEVGWASAEPGTLMGDSAVMLSLYPEFPKDMSILIGEFVFLLDRSGSMSGSHLARAKDTLLLLLKSLPLGCYFNIYSFGSSFEHIFPKSVEYTQKTMKEALKEVEKMQADLVGTEILAPLKHVYSQSCIPDYPRQLFVFTDGEVENTKEVINLVKSNSGSHRCFSFGIGGGASTALINGLAKEGGGYAQFITGSDQMESKVIQSLRFAMQPAVVDISVKWDLPKGVSATVMSPPLISIFQGQRSLLYAQLTGQNKEAAEGCVTVKYSLAGRPTENKLNFSLKPTEDTGLTVHRLAARSLIRSLEQEQEVCRGQIDDAKKKKMIDLSVQSGVRSSFTAFIAVNKTSGEAVKGPLLRIPLPLIMAFLHSFGQERMLGSAAHVTIDYCELKGRLMGFDEVSIGDRMEGANCELHGPHRYGEAFIGDMMKGTESKRKRFHFPKLSLKKKDKCTGSAAHVTIDYFELHGPHRYGEAFIGDMMKEYGGPRSREEQGPLLELVSLQTASGCWELEPALAKAVGKTSKDLEKKRPSTAKKEVWATILALVWLHGLKAEAKDEWELLVMKAVTWLQSQNASGLAECVEAANSLLGCSVQKTTFGI